jgi:hypothetical protein
MIAAPVISFCHAGDHVCGISKRFDLGEGATQLWYRDAGFILGYDAEHDVSLYEPHSSYELESGRAAHRVALALAYAPVVSAADEPVAPDRAPPPPMPHPDGGLLLALGAALLRVRRAAPLEQPELSDAEPLCRAPAVRRSWSIGHGLHARPPAVPVRALTVRALTARAQGSARVTHSA